jgi:hypothetical protein
MTARAGVTIALGLFAAASGAYVVVDELTRPEAAAPAAAEPAGDRLVAYYFHGNRRCATCNTIEAYAREAVASAFPEELRSGRLVWRTVNFEEPANAHFRESYGLYSSTLVLSDVRGGRERAWVELEQVWLLVRDKPAFLAYVARETRALLGPAR